MIYKFINGTLQVKSRLNENSSLTLLYGEINQALRIRIPLDTYHGDDNRAMFRTYRVLQKDAE